jgi:chromate transporter
MADLGRAARGEPANEASAVGFWEAFRYWVKLGFINFGGPAGQIAIMHKDLVERKQWIGDPQFLRALNFCTLLPGPEAQQLATYIGWRLHGLWGGLAAGLWFILPSVAVLWALAWLVAAYGEVSWVAGLLHGVQPVVIAIVVEAVLRLGRRTLHHRGLVVLAAGAFVAIYLLHIPFPAIVAAAAFIGVAMARWWPGVLRRPGSGTSEGSLPQPRFPPFSRTVGLVTIFVLLWLVPVSLLVLWQGREGLFPQQAQFFTGAAFVTFGGAYSVLSYVADAAVNTYHWIEPSQMVQALALAESTPGPLIMVNQFVGFMGGWRLHGELSPLLAGTIGAATVTYVTFLPSFLFIFVGAPYIEALAASRRLQAALVGVMSAVVGVILNLAVFFASHVLFPSEGGVDAFAIALAIATFVALRRLRWQIHTVVGLGAAIGILWELTRNGLG